MLIIIGRSSFITALSETLGRYDNEMKNLQNFEGYGSLARK
jgi:hypothetical protein